MTGMEFWNLGVVPSLVGFATGCFMRHERRSYKPFVVAPILSCLVVCVVVFIWDLQYRYSHNNPDSANHTPVIVQSLLGTIVYSPGIFLIEAVPGIAGTALAQWMKATHP